MSLGGHSAHGCHVHELYLLRDSEAREQNIGIDALLDNDALYLIARTGTIDFDDCQGNNQEFLRNANEQIDSFLNNFP